MDNLIGRLVSGYFVTRIAAAPNGMELTVESVTPFARGRANGVPLSTAAHPQRYALR
jgi:hypothetical protein